MGQGFVSPGYGKKPDWSFAEDAGRDLPPARTPNRGMTREQKDFPDLFIGTAVGLSLDEPCWCECHKPEQEECLVCVMAGCEETGYGG